MISNTDLVRSSRSLPAEISPHQAHNNNSANIVNPAESSSDRTNQIAQRAFSSPERESRRVRQRLISQQEGQTSYINRVNPAELSPVRESRNVIPGLNSSRRRASPEVLGNPDVNAVLIRDDQNQRPATLADIVLIRDDQNQRLPIRAHSILIGDNRAERYMITGLDPNPDPISIVVEVAHNILQEPYFFESLSP